MLALPSTSDSCQRGLDSGKFMLNHVSGEYRSSREHEGNNEIEDSVSRSGVERSALIIIGRARLQLSSFVAKDRELG